jgi:hypothetical protein
VAEQFLHGSEVHAVSQEASGIGGPELVDAILLALGYGLQASLTSAAVQSCPGGEDLQVFQPVIIRTVTSGAKDKAGFLPFLLPSPQFCCQTRCLSVIAFAKADSSVFRSGCRM